MRVFHVWFLVLLDGGRLYVNGNNRVEAFDRLQLLYPCLVKGFTYRDLKSGR